MASAKPALHRHRKFPRPKLPPGKLPCRIRRSVPRLQRGRSAADAYRQGVLGAVLSAARSLTQELGGWVGRRRLINFLRGSQVPPAGKDRQNHLECYALLEDSRADWLGEVIDRLTEEGYLVLRAGRLPVLTVSDEAEKWLRGDCELSASLFPARPRLGENRRVEEKLRVLRRQLALRDGRAPYGVFPNVTLAALAAAQPKSLADLARIPGLGEARIRRYGQQILAALRR